MRENLLERVYESARRVIVKMIAYKFRVSAETFKMLTGLPSSAREAAKELSDSITRDEPTERLEYALENFNFS